MNSIVTLTLNPTIDKNTTVRRVVAEHKLRCTAPTFHPGGGGLNVSRAISKLGGDSVAAWTCGGAIGQMLSDLLSTEGIDHHPIPIRELTRQNMVVFEEETTQQFRFGMPGPHLSEKEIQACLRFVRELQPVPEFLVLSGSLPPGAPDDFYGRLAGAAPEGVHVVLDASGEALRRGMGERVFLIKPNIRELEQLADHPLDDDAAIRDAARELIDAGRTKGVLVSLGSGGAMLVTQEICHQIRSPTVRIRSKVGAGDSTVAGVVLALTRGSSLPEAACFGVAAGAAAVMTEGTHLCRREDAERLYRTLCE